MPPDDDGRTRQPFDVWLCNVCGKQRRAYIRHDGSYEAGWQCWHRQSGKPKRAVPQPDDRQLELKF